MTEQRYATKSLDHLGLVSSFCREIGLVEIIDSCFPNQRQQKNLSYGQCVLAMLLNGLGFVGRTLHMYSEYFKDKPTERLIAPGIMPEHINDDVLGRCLDNLYAYGVSDLYQKLGEKVIEHLGLPCHGINIDSTSFHTDGQYDTEDDFKGITITQGYSRDHRPELNQAILNLITENQAGIPVYMQACSGNTNDSQSFKKIVKSHIKSLKAAQASRYLIGDAALYTTETINELSEQKQLFITRVPRKYTEAKSLIATSKQCDWESIDDNYEGTWCSSEYGGVAQQWLMIRSHHANTREVKTLDKRLFKSSEKAIQSFKALCRKEYRCVDDAMQALMQWQEQQDIANVEAHVESVAVHNRRGRPCKDSQAQMRYKITGHVYSDVSKRTKAQQDLGLFILATNDMSNALSMAQMLAQYKSQQAVERGFRFLKSPDFLTASFFLKSPSRIEALLMIMTCCLMVYAALEHKIREKLKTTESYFPDMKNKPSQNPTARWVFQCFQGIDVLIIDNSKELVLNLMERQKTIILCLGPPYEAIYS